MFKSFKFRRSPNFAPICPQLIDSHVVNGRVATSELDNDLVGESLSHSKLRSNIFLTEDQDWKEVEVRS